MRPLIVILFVLTVFTSQAQLRKFKVDVPVPARLSLPDSVRSITILNRSMTPEFRNMESDTLQKQFYQRNFKTSTVILDSLAADTTIRTLGEMLYDSYRYDVVIPVDRNISRYLPFTRTPEKLTWDYVENICNTYNTDLLIVLENLSMKVVTDYQRQNEFINDGFYRTHYATMDYQYRAHWRMYEPKTQTILVNFIDSDTLYWDSYEFSLKDVFAKLPAVKTGAIETGIYTAMQLTKVIAPDWKNETRYYFQLKDENYDKGITLAADGKWDEALEWWMKYVDSGSKVKTSKVMFNIALAYEMIGDLKEAINWINKSKQTYYREVTNHYHKTLSKRYMQTVKK